MAYLPPFDSDVFISYAHNDDDHYGEEKRGWVAELHKDLEQRVRTWLGEDPAVWRDQSEIRTNEDFEQKIVARLAKTATLLCVISKSFLKRPWCIRELNEFAACAERNLGLQIGDKKRIFKIEKLPVPRTELEHLSPFQGSGSYKFYAFDPDDAERAQEFRPLFGGEYFKGYLRQLDDLAKDIATLLEQMKKACAETRSSVAASPAFYLADTTSDLDEAANEIRRDLKDRGYVVLPDGDLPHRTADFKQKVRDALKHSVISVHLVGKEYGVVLEGETAKSIAWLQNDLAMERNNTDANFFRYVWIPPEFQPSDERQQKFVEYLRNDPAAQIGADVLEKTNLEALKTLLKDKLEEIDAKRQLEKRLHTGSASDQTAGDLRKPAFSRQVASHLHNL